ncbi:MAG: hypothetical protein ACPK85_11680 [Methanosarcina sp.]
MSINKPNSASSGFNSEFRYICFSPAAAKNENPSDIPVKKNVNIIAITPKIRLFLLGSGRKESRKSTRAVDRPKIKLYVTEIQLDSKIRIIRSKNFAGRPVLLFNIRSNRISSKSIRRAGEGKKKKPRALIKAATKAESSESGSISLAKTHAIKTDIPALKPESKL